MYKLLLVIVISLFIIGCSKQEKFYAKPIQVYHLHVGKYVYQDDKTGNWYWLLVNDSTESRTYYNGWNYTTKGVMWSLVETEDHKLLSPDLEEIGFIDPRDIIRVNIAVDHNGFPAIEDDNLKDPQDLPLFEE